MQEKPELFTRSANFWFVWTKKGKKPTFIHTDYEAARAEAERLAVLRPGATFILLHAREKVSFSVPTDGADPRAFPAAICAAAVAAGMPDGLRK